MMQAANTVQHKKPPRMRALARQPPLGRQGPDTGRPISQSATVAQKTMAFALWYSKQGSR